MFYVFTFGSMLHVFINSVRIRAHNLTRRRTTLYPHTDTARSPRQVQFTPRLGLVEIYPETLTEFHWAVES